MSTKERYSGGYSSLIIEQFKGRALARQGAFLLPYLKSGITVLDCGCGPGSMTLDIAERVDPGWVFALDNSPIQIAQASLLQRQRTVPNASFVMGSAYELPYLDNQFDVVFAHAVLYHLRSPGQVLDEFRRVLKPGGIVALRDACHVGDIMTPATPGLSAAWDTIGKVFLDQGGDVDFGARHKQLLLAHGFSEITIGCSYDMFVSDAEKDGIRRYWQAFLGVDHRQLIRDREWVTEAELESQCAALTEWCANPASFFARARCEAVAVK